MKKNSKAIAIIITLVMCLAIAAACGGDGGGQAPVAPPVVPQVPSAPPAPGDGGMTDVAPADPAAVYAEHIDIIVDNNNIAVINPFNPSANPTSTNWVFTMVHDRLIERDDHAGEFVGFLAESWDTDDYQTFTFNLRDDVFFHNGQKFTADDVAFTIEYAKEFGAGSPGLAQWNVVESWNVVNDTTIVLTLQSVFVDFYHNLAVAAGSIISRSALEADPDTGTYIGTGPYIVDQFVSNDFVRLVRNDNYWNDRMNIITPTVTLRFVPEMATRTIRMQTGESQLSFGTSADDVALFQADPDNFQVLPQTFNTIQGYSFNLNDPLLSDYNLRMAIMHATDRADIALFAAGEWAAALDNTNGGGTIWAFATEYRNNDIPIIEFDLDKSREYLAESNYNGEEIELAAAITTNIRAVQALQQQLAMVGINTRIAEMDSPGLSAYMIDPDGGVQMVFFSLQMNNSAGSYRNLFFPGASQNRMQYNNPVITEMLIEADAELNVERRRALYREMQEIIAQDPPFFQVFWRINGTVAAAGLGGIRLPADNLQNDYRQVFQIIGYE